MAGRPDWLQGQMAGRPDWREGQIGWKARLARLARLTGKTISAGMARLCWMARWVGLGGKKELLLGPKLKKVG